MPCVPITTPEVGECKYDVFIAVFLLFSSGHTHRFCARSYSVTKRSFIVFLFSDYSGVW